MVIAVFQLGIASTTELCVPDRGSWIDQLGIDLSCSMLFTRKKKQCYVLMLLMIAQNTSN
jgi:hypothetical protein